MDTEAGQGTGVKKERWTQVWGLLEFPLGFPGGSEVKASAWNAGNLGSIPGLGRSPGKGNGNALQYSCLESSLLLDVEEVEGVCVSRG